MKYYNSKTLEALKSHHAKRRPRVNRMVAKLTVPYWKFGCAVAWQLAVGIRYYSEHISGRWLRSVIVMIPGVTVSVLRSSQERYTEQELTQSHLDRAVASLSKP